MFLENLEHILLQLEDGVTVDNYTVVQTRLEKMTDQYYHQLEQDCAVVVNKGKKRIIRGIARYERV